MRLPMAAGRKRKSVCCSVSFMSDLEEADPRDTSMKPRLLARNRDRKSVV